MDALTGFPPSPRSYLAVVIIQLLNFSFCVVRPNTHIWTKVAAIVEIILSGTCVLAIIQFMWQSFQRCRVTKQWKLNRYVRLITKQGVFYFFACVCIHPSVFSTVSYLKLDNNRADNNLVTASFCLTSLTYWVFRERFHSLGGE